jgi:hypothetical protein
MVKQAIQMILEADTTEGERYVQQLGKDVEQRLSKSFNYVSVETRYNKAASLDIVIYLDEKHHNALIDIYASRGPDPDIFGRIMVEWYFPDKISEQFNYREIVPKGIDDVPYDKAADKIF